MGQAHVLDALGIAAGAPILGTPTAADVVPAVDASEYVDLDSELTTSLSLTSGLVLTESLASVLRQSEALSSDLTLTAALSSSLTTTVSLTSTVELEEV